MNTQVSPLEIAPVANTQLVDFSKHRNLIGNVFNHAGLAIVSHEILDILEDKIFQHVIRPSNYIVLENTEECFYLLCPLDDQSGILSIPHKYKNASDHIVAFEDVTPERSVDCTSNPYPLKAIKKRFKDWADNTLSTWLHESEELMGDTSGVKLKVRKSKPYLTFQFDFYEYYSNEVYELFEAGLKFIIVPEYGDGSAIALYRNFHNFNNSPEQPLTQGVVPVYIPMMNVLGFGELAVQENIYTMGLSDIAKLALGFPHEQCYGVYPGDYSLFDKFPDLLRNPLTEKEGVLHRYHGETARNLELDRVFGSKVAKSIGFNTPKYSTLNRGVLNAQDGMIVFKDMCRDFENNKVAVKRINDSFLTILDLTDTKAFDILKSYNDTLDLFIQEYIGDQSGELNLMFLVAGGHVKAIGFSCETNKLLANNTGGKVGNCSTYHLVGDSYKDSPLQTIMDYYESLFSTWVSLEDGANKNSVLSNEFYGWVDVTLLAIDGCEDLHNPLSYKFVEWMVRNAVDNFSVLVSNMETSYPDALETLAHTGSVDIKWRDEKEFIVGYDMFQVNFVTPNSIAFIECPDNFIPVDAGVGTHIIETDGKGTVYMPINSQDLARLGNFNTALNVPKGFAFGDLSLRHFAEDSEAMFSSIPNVAYRGNLSMDWNQSLLYKLSNIGVRGS